MGPCCSVFTSTTYIFDGISVGHIRYDDDLQVYVQVPRDSIEEGIAKLAIVARKVSDCAIRSGLHLNASKTQAIYFATPYSANLIEKMGLSGTELEQGVIIPFPETICSLGVILDRSLFGATN